MCSGDPSLDFEVGLEPLSWKTYSLGDDSGSDGTAGFMIDILRVEDLDKC